MDTSRFYFTQFNDVEFEQSQKVIVPSNNNKEPILNSEIIEIIDVVAPINPVTGMRENEVSMLLSQNISSIEKQAILSRMQQIPPSERHNMSDEDLLNMLPSRYNSTMVDVDHVRQWFETNVFDTIDASTDVSTDASTDASTE